MIGFEFKVNKTFLDEPQHPITIVKHVVPGLKREKFLPQSSLKGNRIPIKVSGIGPATYSGWIYFGATKKYGQYYQIRFKTTSPTARMGDLRIGDKIWVIFDKRDGQTHVLLSNWEDKKSFDRFLNHLSKEAAKELLDFLIKQGN
jgi:hypothetical protein